MFSGEGTAQLDYHLFSTSFNDVVGNRSNISNAVKLNYLKSYLKGYASKIINHLAIQDENQDVALSLLNSEFLDEQAIVDDLIKKLLNLNPKFYKSFSETKLFVIEARCIISDFLPMWRGGHIGKALACQAENPCSTPVVDSLYFGSPSSEWAF